MNVNYEEYRALERIRSLQDCLKAERSGQRKRAFKACFMTAITFITIGLFAGAEIAEDAYAEQSRKTKATYNENEKLIKENAALRKVIVDEVIKCN